MSDLKFKCPQCGQPILVDAREAGRKLVCPSCKHQLTVPKTKPAGRNPPASTEAGGATRPAPPPTPKPGPARVNVPQSKTPAPPRKQPVPPPATPAPTKTPTPIVTAAPLRVGSPPHKPPVPPAATPQPKKPAQPTTQPIPVTAAPAPEPPPSSDLVDRPAQIAALTNSLKRSIVEAARELIADPQRWIPSIGEDGRLAYAARHSQGEWMRVEAGSDDATHHSLMGAILRELHRRNVAPTATGRTEFLDREIPDALAKIVPAPADPQALGQTPEAIDPRLGAVSHADCLKVLEALAANYTSKETDEIERPTLARTRSVSLDELLVRADRDELMTVTEVLRAVHAELVGLHHRVTELEKAAGSSSAAAAPK